MMKEQDTDPGTTIPKRNRQRVGEEMTRLLIILM